MFTIGKTYQIVLNTDLDGNTLPFPHTMVGTCLSFDKEYATFLDPMTNLVRGMKIQQGEPKTKESMCKTVKVSPNAPTVPTVPTAKAPTVPTAKAPTSAAPNAPIAPVKAAPKDVKAAPKDEKAVDDKAAPKEETKEENAVLQEEKAKGPLPADAVEADVNKQLLKMFLEHLASKETVFREAFTTELETIKKKNQGPFLYSITGGFIKNPVKIGLPPADYIKKNYSKDDKTCFFLFNTKQIVDDKYKTAELVFLAALPKTECEKYTSRKPISF
jgi:hypothetical protein